MTKIHIVHGWTYSLTKWDQLIDQLRSLGFEPIMHRVPGLSAPSDKVWTIDSYVDWLRDELTGDPDPIVIGHSNGGRISMAYDIKYPNHIKHLFLISSAGIYHDEVRLSMKRRVFAVFAKILKPFIRGPLRKFMYRLIGATDYGNAKPNMRKTMKNVTDYDKQFDVSKVSAKTTIIWGRADKATPFSDAQKILDQIQNPDQIYDFDGVGHSAHAERPNQVADIIVKTLSADRP